LKRAIDMVAGDRKADAEQVVLSKAVLALQIDDLLFHQLKFFSHRDFAKWLNSVSIKPAAGEGVTL
jgi:hypothetical protein